MKETDKLNPEKSVVLYHYLSQKLSSDGIRIEELNRIKDLKIGEQTVDDFVRLNLNSGEFQWRGRRGHTLVNANRKYRVGFTPNEESGLKRKAQKLDLEVDEYITGIVLNSIKE